MRKLQRATLSTSALARLATLTGEVQRADDPEATAKKHWKNRTTNRDFEEIRETLAGMASGRSRCMYCEDSLGTDIEHFWPKARFPARCFDWQNYLLACSHCNSNLKREAFPQGPGGEPLLIDPTRDAPTDHLLFISVNGTFESVGPKGTDSIRVFGLNDERAAGRLPSARRQAFISLVALLREFDRQVIAGEDTRLCRAAVVDFPFSSVLHWLVHIAGQPAGVHLLDASVVEIVRTHGVEHWLEQ